MIVSVSYVAKIRKPKLLQCFGVLHIVTTAPPPKKTKPLKCLKNVSKGLLLVNIYILYVYETDVPY